MSVLMRAIAARLRNRKFSVAEVSAMTGLGIVEVNNAVAEIAGLGVASSAGGRRTVEYSGVFCVLLIHDMTGWAPPTLRREILEEAVRHPKKAAIAAKSQNVVVPVDGLRKKARQALRAFYEAEDAVTSSEAILMGEPCVTGTRIPAYVVAEIAVQRGISEALETYPQLSEKQVNLVRVYCTANPRRGRPKRSALPSNAKEIGRVKAVRQRRSQGGRR